MNSFLLNRQLGSIDPHQLAQAHNERAHRSLQSAGDTVFRLQAPQDALTAPLNRSEGLAHPAGVNSIAIERFEGRYLISAGADSSVAVWDLEEPAATYDERETLFVPLAKSARTSTTESLGITHISFYPFDSLAFLTSGYDHTLKLISSETLRISATFDLGSIVYSHATSNVSSSLLVACATQHPAVRLIDLHSGASTHSLSGHSGSVLSVAWHPKLEHILASAATDGTIRLWDVRRSASSLGVLDLEDSIGLAGYDGKGTGARPRERGRAHRGIANGIVWSADGRHLVSVGHDERMRVWDMTTGANTLANFGPVLKNSTTAPLLPLLAPEHLSKPGAATIYYPNPKEILSFDMYTGDMQSRLRVQSLPGGGGGGAQAASSRRPTDIMAQNLKNRTTCLAWRAHQIELYSAHGDGTIRCWASRLREEEAAEEDERAAEDESAGAEAAERKRKRDELEQFVRDVTQKKITFT